MKILNNIFSVKNVLNHKIFVIFGIKFKFRNKSYDIDNLVNFANYLNDVISSHNQTIYEVCQRLNFEKNIKNERPNLQYLLGNIQSRPQYVLVDKEHNYLNILLNCEEWKFNWIYNSDNILINWGIRPFRENVATIQKAIYENKKCIFFEDGFIRSINTFADKKALPKFQKGISFTLDDLTCCFDATKPSRMELMLNDKNLVITEEQKQRARKCIDKIVETHLTKYNHQPIYEPKIGREGVKKVLVVDQSYGDMSIAKGLADDNTFKKMLQSAIDENPDADIIVKTHPDTIAGAGGYYKGLKAHDNIYTQTEPINPISLIKYVDKVYVCTTQFGFEALMCGKEVHVFGMPFYAGWGLTHDRQKCERRTNTRTLEEIFYIAYIMYTYYVNPDKKCRCEIEEAIDYLLKLREEYFTQIVNIY